MTRCFPSVQALTAVPTRAKRYHPVCQALAGVTTKPSTQHPGNLGSGSIPSNVVGGPVDPSRHYLLVGAVPPQQHHLPGCRIAWGTARHASTSRPRASRPLHRQVALGIHRDRLVQGHADALLRNIEVLARSAMSAPSFAPPKLDGPVPCPSARAPLFDALGTVLQPESPPSRLHTRSRALLDHDGLLPPQGLGVLHRRMAGSGKRCSKTGGVSNSTHNRSNNRSTTSKEYVARATCNVLWVPIRKFGESFIASPAFSAWMA